MRCWLIILCLLQIIGVWPVYANESITIHLKWKHQFQFAGLYAAIEKGYFAEEGLGVTLLERDPLENPIDRVLSGQAQYGVSDAGLLIDRLHGQPVVLLSQIFQHSPLALMTLQSSGIQELNDLIGRRVMVDASLSDHLPVFLLLDLLPNGLDSVQSIPMASRGESLLRGDVDAISYYRTESSVLGTEKPVATYTIQPRDYGVDVYGDNLFTSEMEIIRHPERVKKVVRAVQRGWVYALQHTDEIIHLILKQYNSQNLTFKQLQYEATFIRGLIQPDFVRLGAYERERYEKLAQVLFEHGIVKQRFLDSSFFYSQSTDEFFNTTEQAWINKHRMIRVGIHHWHSFMQAGSDSQVEGVVGDILKIFEAKTGLRVQPVFDRWPNLIAEFKAGHIDILPAVPFSEPASTYGLFSTPYLAIENALYQMQDAPEINSLADLKTERLGIIKGYSGLIGLQKQYPGIDWVEVENRSELIRLLLSRQVKAVYGSRLAMDSYLSRLGVTSVKKRILKTPDDDLLHVLTQPEQPVLRSIINKVLDSIPEKEKQQILIRWLGSALALDKGGETSLTAIEKVFSSKWMMLVLIGVVMLFLSVRVNVFSERFGSDERLARIFSSLRFRFYFMLSVLVVMTLISVMVWQTIESRQQKSLQKSLQQLEMDLDIAMDKVDLWLNEHSYVLQHLAKSQELQVITSNLLSIGRKRLDLNSNAAIEARRFFKKQLQMTHSQGFAILDTEGRTLVLSNHREDMIKNRDKILNEQDLKVVLAGETLFIKPLESPIPLVTGSAFKPMTVFLAIPIPDNNGRVMAVLLCQMDMYDGPIAQIVTSQHSAQKSEVYLIDSQGVMMTPSRFSQELVAVGLFDKPKAEVGSFLLRDPGDLLALVYQPEMDMSSWPLTRMVQALTQLSQYSGLKLEVDTFDRLEHSPKIRFSDSYRDYRGIDVFGIGLWDYSLGMGMIAEIDRSDAMRDFYSIRESLIYFTALSFLVLIFAVMLVLFIGQRATRTILNSKEKLEQRVKDRTLELKASENRFRSIVESNHDAVIVTDSKGIIKLWNPAAESIFGHQEKDILGQSVIRIMPPDAAVKYRATMTTLSERHYFNEIWNKKRELDGLHKDGSLVPLEVSLSYFNINDEPHFGASVRDISERREFEQKLISGREKYENLVNSIGEDHVVFSLDVRSSKLTFVSRGVEKILGLTIDEALSKNWKEAIQWTPESLRLANRMINLQIKGEKRFVEYDLEFLHPKHQRKNFLRVASSPVWNAEQTEVCEIQGFAEDISWQKNYEEQLLKSKTLAEAASRSKSDFLANMSHEIRTPMNAIIGMSNLALKENLGARERNYITKVHQSAEMLLGILNDILDFSKIEANQMNLELINFDLNSVLESFNNIIGYRATEKGLKVSIFLAEDVADFLVGDPLRLGQILLNLGNNAIKFTEQGSIDLTISVEEHLDNLIKLHFCVQDTGIGIPPEKHEYLFKAFSQADNSVSRQYGGSGLGLAICKALLRLMNGDIWVESELGQGAAFHFNAWFELGGMQTNQHQNKDLSEMIQALKGVRLLLVEDNEINQEIVLGLLRETQIQVRIVNHGQEALDVMAQEPFDVVLMDIQMPVMDGYTATRAIRKQDRFKYLPIIAMTANVMESDREKAKQAGMNDHIGKPLDVNHLFMTLVKWVKPQQTSQESVLKGQGDEIDNQNLPIEDAALFNIKGIQKDRVLGIYRRQPLRFKRLLLEFYRSQKDFHDQCLLAIEKEDSASLIQRIQTLGMIARNVGALEIYEKTQTLEQDILAIGSLHDIETGINDLIEILNPILEQIGKHLENKA